MRCRGWSGTKTSRSGERPASRCTSSRELAARDVKVVLTGEGSDELFAGLRPLLDDIAQRARAPPLRPAAAAPGAICSGRALFSDVMPERIRRALSHTFIYADTIPERLILDNWFGLFSPEWQRRIAGPALARDLAATRCLRIATRSLR